MQVMQDSCIPWLGSVPSHWKRGKLKQYVFEISEKNFPVKTTNILSLTNKLGVVPYEEKGNQGNTAKEKYDEYKLAYPDTIVANSMNILIGSVGYCFYFGCVSPVYYVFKNFKNGNLRYINYIFQTTEFQKCLRQFSNGILEIRQRVSAKTILNQDFFFPDLDEQNAIVEYLETKCAQIDTIIAKEQSVIEKLQEYKQSVITEAVTKGLDPKVAMIESNISWIKTIPVTWKVSKLKYVAEFSPKCDFTNIEPDTEVTYTPMEYIKKGNYIFNSEAIGKLSASLTKYEEGDIVIAKVTPCFENGNIAIMNNLKSGKGLGSSELFVFRVPEAIRKFVFYWMQNKLFIEQCVATMTGTGGLKRVSSYYISNSEIFLPPLEMIDDICNYLDEKCDLIERTIRQKELVISKLTEYKKSLIYEIVTGKKEVPHV
jgi:restriction modification system DNA specificity domain protein